MKRSVPLALGYACFVSMASVWREFLRIEFNEEVLAVSCGLNSEHSRVHADGAGDRSVFDDEGDVGVGYVLCMALNDRC